MRCPRTWVAVTTIALALLSSGCPTTCESADQAPVPAGRTPRFAVLASDATRTQISLLDEAGVPIEFVFDGETDVWIDDDYTWEDMLAWRGIELGGRMPWRPLPGGGVTVSIASGARELVRFPLDGSAPEEVRVAPERAADRDSPGEAVRDLVVLRGSEGEERELYALREGHDDVRVLDLDPEDDDGGAVVDRISLADAGGSVAAGPERFVPAFDRLYVGLDRYESASPSSPPRAEPGAIAIVDPRGRRLVGTHRLDAEVEVEVARCAEIVPSLDPTGDPDVARLVVACRGAADDPTDVGALSMRAGVVELRVERDPSEPAREPVITTENAWRSAGLHATLPSRGLVALPGRAVAFVSAGDPDVPRDDVLFVVDLDGEPPEVHRVASAAVFPGVLSGLGSGAFLPEEAGAGLLVWPLERRGVLRRRIRTVPDDAGRLDVVVCPDDDEPACLPEDAALEAPVELCNDLHVAQVRLL